MLSHVQAAFAVQKRYSNLKNGKDFWTAHPIDVESRQQSAEAEIVAWRPKDIPQPGPELLRETFAKHEAEWQAEEAQRERAAKLWAAARTQAQNMPI